MLLKNYKPKQGNYIMKKTLLYIFLLISPFSFKLFAGTTDTVTVSSVASPILEIDVVETTVSLDANSASPGDASASDSDATGSYGVYCNQSSQFIKVKAGAVPSSGSLKLLATTVPSGATAASEVTLTTADQNLVSGISTVSSTGHASTYTYTVAVGDGTMTSEDSIITYTLGATA